MDKDEVVRRLQAIVNQLVCMNNSEFEKSFKDGVFESTFDYFCWGEKAKIQTKIEMKRIEIE